MARLRECGELRQVLVRNRDLAATAARWFGRRIVLGNQLLPKTKYARSDDVPAC